MCFRELNSGGYENTKYRINRFVLQESGKVVEGCLTVKNYWGLLTGDDEVGLEIADILVGQVGLEPTTGRL